MFSEIASQLNIGLVLNSENLGLATALNIGVARAIAGGYQWALLFDQDIAPFDFIVEGLKDAYDPVSSER